MADCVESSMYFLKRDELYARDKVYELKYEPHNGLPKNNMITERREAIIIEDVRKKKDSLCFHQNGFEVLNIDCDLRPEDFDDQEKVVNCYMQTVAHKLKEKLGASRVQVIDYVVSISLL